MKRFVTSLFCAGVMLTVWAAALQVPAHYAFNYNPANQNILAYATMGVLLGMVQALIISVGFAITAISFNFGIWGFALLLLGAALTYLTFDLFLRQRFVMAALLYLHVGYGYKVAIDFLSTDKWATGTSTIANPFEILSFALVTPLMPLVLSVVAVYSLGIALVSFVIQPFVKGQA